MCDTDELFSQFDNLFSQLNEMKTQITLFQQNIKSIEKSVKKTIKDLKKDKEPISPVKDKVKRKPSGFAKPCKISSKLCEFMNLDEGTKVARTDVTRFLISYIKKNKLENISNLKQIMPDDTLKNLLGLGNDDVLDYFNIQKYMNKHFIKDDAA